MRHLALAAFVLLVVLPIFPAMAEEEPEPAAGEVVVEEPPDPAAPPIVPIEPIPPIPPIAPIPPIEPMTPIGKIPTLPPLGARWVEPVPTPLRETVRPRLVTAVLDVRKTHNLPWRCYCSAVRLDVDFMVVGQKNRFVGARVDFYASNGQPIRSVLYPFANEKGQVSAWTHLIQMTQDVQRMHTALMIPYKAFPCACEGDNYLVTARVVLLRREGRAQSSEIARGETTFTVWSSRDDTLDDLPGDGALGVTGAGGNADPSLEGDEYRPQVPFGTWPDHTEMEGEMDRETKDMGRRADAELGPTGGPGPGPSPAR